MRVGSAEYRVRSAELRSTVSRVQSQESEGQRV